jgi:hypothetical protein
MPQRRPAATIREMRVGAVIQEKADDFRMNRAAITEDHGFQQRGPSEIVDVIHVDPGLQ